MVKYFYFQVFFTYSYFKSLRAKKAWLKILLHPCLSTIALLQSLIAISLRSYSMTCNHLIYFFLFSFPIFLPLTALQFSASSSQLFHFLSSCVINCCPYCSIDSSFFFLFQRPSTFFSPDIIFRTFLSNTSRVTLLLLLINFLCFVISHSYFTTCLSDL